MDFSYAEGFGASGHSAYETLLVDCMLGDATLFTRTNGVEAAWRVVDPIIAAMGGQSSSARLPNYCTRLAHGARPRPTRSLPVTEPRGARREEANMSVRRWVRIGAFAAVGLTTATEIAHGQAAIKGGDDVSIRLGALVQGWGDWTQDPVSGGYAQNLYLRRVRLLVGGQVARNITFFMQTNDPNLGRTPKALGSGFIVQDALAEVSCPTR